MISQRWRYNGRGSVLMRFLTSSAVKCAAARVILAISSPFLLASSPPLFYHSLRFSITHLPHGFPERAQQGSVCFSRRIEAVSLKRREELPCFFLHRVPLGKDRDGWKDEIVIFSNGYSK